eukprot:5231115-Amphidinium_carterae.3
MEQIDDAGTTAADTFSSSLATNLAVAANSTSNPNASIVLADAAQQVASSGVEVVVTAAPEEATRTVTTTTATTTVPTTTTATITTATTTTTTTTSSGTATAVGRSSKDDDSGADMLWLNIMAILLGVMLALGCCVFLTFRVVLRPRPKPDSMYQPGAQPIANFYDGLSSAVYHNLREGGINVREEGK